MKTKVIYTEDPIVEQWHLLSQYTYATNISRFITGRHESPPSNEIIDTISGCFRQAAEYFKSGRATSLEISPVLLYYGATNLLLGAYGLMRGEIPQIKNHGMRLRGTPSSNQELADIEIIPCDPSHGALNVFTQEFSRDTDFSNGVPWSLGEILGSIPDLRVDFDLCYASRPPFIIPIETISGSDYDFDRFMVEEINRFNSVADIINLIPDYNSTYLTPQVTNKYIVMYRKLKASEICTYSISGDKYLQLGHPKPTIPMIPTLIILMIMGLYTLSNLSRYRPIQWSPFLHSDASGERMIIEKFVSVVDRYFPSLILSHIMGDRVQFLATVPASRDYDNE